MTSFRFIGLCVCLMFLCSVGLGTSLGAIVAPLNGTEAVDAHGTQDLKVHNPDHETQALKIQKAPDFVIVQGDPDTRRNVNLSASNDEEHLVADIDIPDAEAGELLYSVHGIILRGGGGEGGTPPTWTAAYNRGDARIVLMINETPATTDDYVAYGDNGGILTITLAGGCKDTNYTVNLSQVPIGSPGGEVDFSSVSVMLAGGKSIDVALHGRGIGETTIHATEASADAAPGDIVAHVVPAIDRLQFQLAGGDFQDFPSAGLYVEKGTPVTFKAIPNPSNAQWPSGGEPEWSGTAGVSGVGVTSNLTFAVSSDSMTDTYTIVAATGSQSVSEDAVSWEDDATIELVFDDGTPYATFKAVVYFKVWVPDGNGDGRPDDDGGTVELDLLEDFDDIDSPLVTYETWPYQNGIAQTQEYIVRDNIHNDAHVPLDPFHEPVDEWYGLCEPSDVAMMCQVPPQVIAAELHQTVKAARLKRIGLAALTYDWGNVNVVLPIDAWAIPWGEAGEFLHLTIATTATIKPLGHRKWASDPAVTVGAVAGPAIISFEGQDLPLQLVAATWNNDAALRTHAGWELSDSLSISANRPGDSKIILEKPGVAYAACVWGHRAFVMQRFKCAKRLGEGGVAEWFYPNAEQPAWMWLQSAIGW